MNSRFRIIITVFLTISLLNLPFNPFVFVSANGSLPIKLEQNKEGEIWKLPNGKHVFKVGGEAPPRIYEGGIILNGTEIRSTLVNVDIESIVESEVIYKNENGIVAKENWFIYQGENRVSWDSFSEKNLIIKNIPIIENVGGYTVTDYEKEATKVKSMINIFGTLDIEYKIHEGLPLKHTLNFTSPTGGTFKLCQEYTNFEFDSILQSDIDSETYETINTNQDTKKTMDITTLVNKSLSSFDNKIKSNPKLLLPEIVEFKKNNKLVLGEITSGAKSDFNSFDYDSQQKTAMFCYGEFILNSNESFVVDPDTFTSNNPTLDGHIRTRDTASTSCGPILDNVNNTATLNVDVRLSTGGVPACARSYMEFPTTSITSGSTINDVDVDFDVQATQDSPTTCDWKSISVKPSTSGSTSIWNAIGSGSTYVSGSTTCQTVSNNLSVDLGTTADTDLQTLLPSGYFPVGIMSSNEVRDAGDRLSRMASEEEAAATQKPTLSVTYTVPITSITFDINYFNGTALTSGTVTQSNTTTSRSIAINSTGFAGVFTGLTGNQNMSTKETLDSNFITNKTRNFATATTITSNQNIYSVNCIQTGSGIDVLLFTNNNTDGHTITNTTRPACTTSNQQPIVISWNTTFSADGKSSASYPTKVMAKILNTTAFGQNATKLYGNGTEYPTTWSTPKITSQEITVGTGLQTRLWKFYLWLDARPQIPTGLGATTVSSSQIDLSWTAGISGVAPITGYKITRGLDGITFGTVVSANTGTTATTYSDSGLAQNTLYYYQVQAINSYGTGIVSSSASATSSTPPTGSGSSDGGGGIITNSNFQQLLFGLEIDEIQQSAKPSDLLPLNIHLEYTSEKPIKLIAIDAGEFNSWITHEALPLTIKTELLSVNDFKMIPAAFALRNGGDIPIQLTVPIQYCNPKIGITQNCVEDKIYTILVKLTLEFYGKEYQQSAKITLDLRQQKLSPAFLQNMIIGTILLGIAVGGVTFAKKRINKFETDHRHKSRKKGLGKSKFEQEVSKVIS